jgi:hypothetical protein
LTRIVLKYKIGAVNLELRKFVADKLGNLGNFAVVALVFGQLLAPERFKLGAFLFGILFWGICFFWGYLVLKGAD